MAKILTRLRIDEVSSVDRGAGEGVKILLMKRNNDGNKDKPMSKINTMFSKLFGGGNSDNNVTIDKSLEGLAESVTSILSADEDDVAKGAALTKTFEQFGDHLKSTLTAGSAVAKKEGSEMNLVLLAKALGLADTATEADVAKAIADQNAAQAELAKSVKKMEQENRILKADFTPAESDFYNKAAGDDESDLEPSKSQKKAFRLASHSERATIMKSAEPPLPAHIKKIMDDNEAMAKRLAELEAGGGMVSLTKRAVELGLPEATGGMLLKKAYEGDTESIDKLETHMKSLIETARAGGVFKEFGTSGGNGVVTTAYEELSTLAKNLQKSDPKMTFPIAFAKVYEDPANIDIVKRERGENRPAAA